MKKTLCLLLAALMLLSLCACGQSAAPAADDAAPAEADAPEAAEEVPEEVPATPEPEPLEPYAPYETQYGFRFEYPEEYQNLKGELLWHIFPFGYGQADVDLFYIEVPEGERAAFREKAAADREVKCTHCPVCNLKTTLPPGSKGSIWNLGSSRVYYSLTACPEHGTVAGRIRIRKTEQSRYYAVKTLWVASEREEIWMRQKIEALYNKKNKV